MKKFLPLLILSLTIISSQAADFMQSSNPFPQTSIQRMNNIYESEPATIQQEAKKERKFRFKNLINKDSETKQEPQNLPVYPKVNEGSNSNGSFYSFGE